MSRDESDDAFAIGTNEGDSGFRCFLRVKLLPQISGDAFSPVLLGTKINHADFRHGRNVGAVRFSVLKIDDDRFPLSDEPTTTVLPIPQNKKGPRVAALIGEGVSYSVDSISKPQASRRGSGMYFEFLFFRAHSRSRVERMY